MLSEREEQIVAGVVNGLSNREIGKGLYISENTVKIHLRRVFKKAQVTNRAALVAWVMTRNAGYPAVMASNDPLSFAAHYGSPAKVQLSYDCMVHRHDEWVPTNWHHVWPLGLGGPNVQSNKIKVCMNGHGAIHAFLDLLIKHNGRPPWEMAKHFGPAVRGYASSGWEQAGRPTTGEGAE